MSGEGRRGRRGETRALPRLYYVPAWAGHSRKRADYRFLAIREPLRQLTLGDEANLPFPTQAFGQKGIHKLFGVVTNRASAVADSLEKAGDRLFTFTRLPSSQWKSARTTNAIERLHEEFKRRIKTQTVLPSAETAAMLFWALLASGQITMRKVDGWQSLAQKPTEQTTIDLAA